MQKTQDFDSLNNHLILPSLKSHMSRFESEASWHGSHNLAGLTLNSTGRENNNNQGKHIHIGSEPHHLFHFVKVDRFKI